MPSYAVRSEAARCNNPDVLHKPTRQTVQDCEILGRQWYLSELEETLQFSFSRSLEKEMRRLRLLMTSLLRSVIF